MFLLALSGLLAVSTLFALLWHVALTMWCALFAITVWRHCLHLFAMCHRTLAHLRFKAEYHIELPGIKYL